jgi:hypothetical protein
MAKIRVSDPGNAVIPDIAPGPHSAAEEGRDLRNTVRQASGRARTVGPAMSRPETTEIMQRARGLLKHQ